MISLGRADLALWVNPGATRVYLPALMALPRRRGREGTTVRFEGDDYDTAFRGAGRTGEFDFSVRYSWAQRPLRVALEHLIDELAPAQFDHRLLFRTHLESALDLPAELQAFVAAGSSVAVEVFELTTTPAKGYDDVSFTARIVEHSFEA